jgi:phage-related protein
MLMLGTVLTRLVQKVGLLISSVTEYLTKKLSQLLGVLTALKTQSVELLNLCVSSLLKLKALLAQCITLVLSIKGAVTPALIQLWALGQQLVTTVRQILQRVMQVFKRGK